MAQDENSGPAIRREANDELSGEVSLRIKIDKTGLTVGGKSRALNAADRLLGGLAGIPAAYVEGLRARIELRNRQQYDRLAIEPNLAASEDSSKKEFIDDLSVTVLQDRAREFSVEDQDLQRATVRLVAEEVRKQINRGAVWAETEAALEATPAQLESPPEQDAVDIDADWIATFATHAETATSERLRRLWGKILAGEIRAPGSFSLSTLRMAAELDKEVALKFQERIQDCFSNKYLLRSKNLAGQELLDYVLLEEAGLINGASSDRAFSFSPTHGQSVDVAFGNFAIRVELAGNTSIPVAMLTRAGRELVNILPAANSDAGARRCLKLMEPKPLSARLIMITEISRNGLWRGVEVEKLI